MFKSIQGPRPPGPDLTAKIETLTNSLNSSAKAIAEVEREIKQRKRLVEQLQHDARTAEQLRAVSREQADAIAQTIKGELEAQQQRDFWKSFGWNVFYVLLGAGFTELIHVYKRWRWQRRRDW